MKFVDVINDVYSKYSDHSTNIPWNDYDTAAPDP
jgi:hypothetical protein